jgi:hypothetical protein
MMTRPLFVPTAFCSALLGAFTVFLLPACRTEDITLPQTVVATSPAGPSQGALFVIVAPMAATPAEEQADEQANKLDVAYHVLIDGQVETDGQFFDAPIVTQPGVATLGGYYDAGVHHIELAAPDSPAVFAVDGMITSGAATRLYVFGPRGGLQARFDSYPVQPPAGKYHLSAINLVRAGGVQIEVVSCTDAATCTPVSPPLSLGDTFDTDADISNVPTNSFGIGTLSASGAGYGYRQVATPSLPTPPIIDLGPASIPGCLVEYTAMGPAAPPGVDTCPVQSITGFIAGPIYLSDDGNLIQQELY